MKEIRFKRIMIFGRPGSGKSTFASWLSKFSGLPLHHLDKHFYLHDWKERNYDEFLDIQQRIVNTERWIVDGNNTRSFERRWSKADLVLYFNYSKFICYFRVLKRFLRPNKRFDDRAPGCRETINIKLLKYMWSFEKRVDADIKVLKERYPDAVYKEIISDSDLDKLKRELIN